MRAGAAARALARLERIAAEMPARWDPAEWPAECQLAAALDYLDFQAAFGDEAVCTDRELGLLEEAAGGLPEGWRGHVRRMDPRHQEERERWLFENRVVPFEPWRERVRRRLEEQSAFAERSRQRDRELLERNRASVGLPPLTPEQIIEMELEGTAWEGEGGLLD